MPEKTLDIPSLNKHLSILEGKNKSAFFLLWFLLRSRLLWRLIVLLAIILSTICLFGMMLEQRDLIHFITTDKGTTSEKAWLCFVFLGCALFYHGLLWLCRFISLREANIMHRVLAKKTYQHILQLDILSGSHYGSGELMAFYATDIQVIVTFIDDLWINVLSYVIPIVAAPFIIAYISGLPVWLLSSWLCAALFITFALGIRQSRFFISMKKHAGKRLNVVSEVVQHMQNIRMLNWTQLMEDKILLAFRKELKNRLAMIYNSNTLNSIAFSMPFILNLITLSYLFFVMHRPLTAGEVMSLFWVFGIMLLRPMRMLPFYISIFLDCFSSARRLQTFWQLPLEEDGFHG